MTILVEALILNPVLVAILGIILLSLMKLWDIFPENIVTHTDIDIPRQFCIWCQEVY